MRIDVPARLPSESVAIPLLHSSKEDREIHPCQNSSNARRRRLHREHSLKCLRSWSASRPHFAIVFNRDIPGQGS
jgi:hypothetical protein